MIIDIEKIKAAAMAVEGWGNSDQAWLDTSEDVAAAVVGHIDEDGNEYPVVTVDCDQYDSGDSLPLAKFYATANPQAVLELITRLEAAERDAARFRWLAETTSENEAYNETHANWPSGKLADCVDRAIKESEK